MATKKVPARTKRAIQPQAPALLPRYAQWGWVYTPSAGVNNLGSTKIAGVFNGSAGYGGANQGGKAYDLGSTLTSTIQLGNTTCKFTQSKPVSGLIVFRPTLAANRVPLFIASSATGGLYVKVSPSYAIQIDATTVSNLIVGTAGDVKFNETNTVAFCIEPRVVDGGTGRVSFALNGKLVTGTWTATPDFTATSFFGSQGLSESNPHQQMLSCASTASISNAELVALSNDPWQIFQPSPAKSSLWLNATAAPSGPAFQADAFQNNAFQTATGGISATLAITLDSVTVSSIATVGHPATLAITLDSVAFAASATAGHPATLAITLDSVAFAASATAGHPATLAITLDSVTVSASATAGHPATLAITLDSVAFAASATTNNGISAVLAITLDSVAFASVATVGHSATLTVTLDDLAFAASATAGHSATLAATLDTIAVASVATVGHSATLAVTLDGISFAASATQANGLIATLAITLDDISFSSAIVSGHSATVAFTLDDINVTITAVNSSGPPVTGYVETLIVLRTFTDRKRF